MWTVCVIKSLVNKRLYTGSTNNLERRLSEHNSGKSRYTRTTKPFILVYKEEHPTRLEARSQEKFYKTGKGRELLKEKMRW